MFQKGKVDVPKAYQPEHDSIKAKDAAELRQREGGLEVLDQGDREAVEKALEQMEDAAKDEFMTAELQQVFADSEEGARALSAMREQLDGLDKDWAAGEDDFMPHEVLPEVSALKARYEEASTKWEALMDQLNDANDEYEASPQVKSIRQHKEVLEKSGIDLRERSSTLESETSDLQSRMEAADKAGTHGYEIEQMLSVWAGLKNEQDAIQNGEWQKKEEFGWIPTKEEGGFFGVKMDVPDWIPNFKVEARGKHVLSRDAVKNRADRLRETSQVRKSAIERGDDPDAF